MGRDGREGRGVADRTQRKADLQISTQSLGSGGRSATETPAPSETLWSSLPDTLALQRQLYPTARPLGSARPCAAQTVLLPDSRPADHMHYAPCPSRQPRPVSRPCQRQNAPW